MIIRETPIPGAFLVEPEPVADVRGHFARTWSRREFSERGLDVDLDHCGASFNHKKGTLRGMHFQEAPHEEVKLVRCTRGSVYDVVLDLRPHSPTRHRWFAAELSADNGKALYIPKGCAHGFQTLEDGTEIFYMISVSYHPEAARGVRWDDPAFAIDWPLVVTAISPKDRALAPLASPDS
ncbi:MAG: dTDP-4-dehydrorhamnose 3,5-epimerase [Isosphaeraceae bacterium]